MMNKPDPYDSLKAAAYSRFLNMVSRPRPQMKGTVIYAVNESDKLIPHAAFRLLSNQAIDITKTGTEGVYNLELKDKTLLYELQIAFNADGYMPQKRLFLVADQTNICIRAGKESDLYISHNLISYPLSISTEFLQLVHKKEIESQVMADSRLKQEVEQRTEAVRQKFHLPDRGPVHMEYNTGNVKVNGLVLPDDNKSRQDVLNTLRMDTVLYPAALFILWDEGQPNQSYSIAGRTVTFSFPEMVTDEHIGEVLNKKGFEALEIIPSSHRLNASPGKQVNAHYNDILSLDMIRKASELVTGGEAYYYSLKRTGQTETNRDH